MREQRLVSWRRMLSTAARLWRSALEFCVMCMFSLQDLGHELLHALWSQRFRDARFASPHARDTSSTSASSPARRSRNAAMEFLEKFRHGPENQSEWNLFLWRVTFPMVTLVLFTLFAVLGKMGHAAYSLVVCPVWYFANFILVVYPFGVVFRFPDFEPHLSSTRRWKALAVVSVVVSSIEWYVSSPKSRVSWVVGNTLFGIIALVAIPLFFMTQSRIPREQPGALNDHQARDSGSVNDEDRNQGHGTESQRNRHDQAPSEPETTTMISPTATTHARHRTMTTTESNDDDAQVVVVATHAHEKQERGDDDMDEASPSSSASLLRPQAPKSHLAGASRRQRHATLRRPRPANTKSNLITISAVCLVIVWLAMFTSYNSARNADSGKASRYWFVLYLCSPILCIVLFCTRQQHTNFSFDHVVVYGMLIVHLPIFLGHFCIRLFAMAEDSGGHHHGSSWMKLGISVLYLLVMQGYFFVITHVVNAMAEPFAHPSLLYIGQLYYYLFWYILVGSDTPIDALYWGMLLVNNIHIAFLNTGIYTDVKRSSSGCVAMPLNMSVGSSVAVCFRASSSSFLRSEKINKDAPRSTSSRSAPLDDDEMPYASESDGFLSDQEAILPVRITSRRAPHAASPSQHDQGDSSADLEANSVSDTKMNSKSSNKRSSFDIACPPASAIRAQCAQIATNSKKSGAGRKSGARHPNVVLSQSHRASTEHLKPLYFLMKLAEQDNMADTTALILVPSLITLLAVFEKPSEGIAILYDQRNMWLRCICMFIGRLGGAYLAREIFAYKLKSRLRTAGNTTAIGTIEGMSTRLWIHRLMLQDFHHQFWYLMVVTIVVTFACFDRVDLPLRFALLT
uniref:Transmembrane protein n=1 Tax=Globisporangium ultimum (strain ATCC 200006 / CBS 805.95 / DAOM BR144) TaxID=431595 RepID=K3WE59_GLOUD